MLEQDQSSKCCNNPSPYYSREFDSVVCSNCGVVHEGEYKVHAPSSHFVHLRVHTHLSLLRAICKHNDLIEIAKSSGMKALAKTDFNNLCGAPTFVRDCVNNGIKPILGVDFSVHVIGQIYSITLIALNRKGYKELVALSTLAYQSMDKKLGHFIKIFDIPQSENIIALVDSGCPKASLDLLVNECVQRVETFIDIYRDSQELANVVREIANKHGVSVVATGNVLFTKEEDFDAYKIALKIGKHDVIDVEDHVNYWFKTPDFFSSLFGFDDEWLAVTTKIADWVEDYGLINKDPIMPTFKDKTGEYTHEQAHTKLERDCWNGLLEKGLLGRQEYIDRLKMELEVMKRKTFSSYFLIISEIVEYMKSQGMLIPFGRGSSVGSLVCYAIDIIAMDPIRWRVPFERFINEGRVDLPDVDTDITQGGRPQVLAHIADIHGHERVAQIATFQTMTLKAAIDNVGRVLGVPHSLNRLMRKDIPDDVKDVDSLPAKVKEDMAQTPGWIDACQALDGVAKNLGYHAAGVVIANQPLVETVPVLPEEDNGLAGIQYDMHDCEVLGLLKLDMLGLRNLDIIQHALERIEERGDKIDVHNLPFDDRESYKLVQSGNYVSLFQLDSTGYRQLCKKLSPDNFEHIMALNALYRPGPLEGGMTDEYVARRHGGRELVGWHPWLDEDLERSYQVPLFQEQVMAISKKIAGFDDVEADKYRKAIGKKDKVKFDAAQEKFKQGAMKRENLSPPVEGLSVEQWVDDLLHKLAGYARYGWNIGHCLKWDSKVLTCDRGYINIRDVKVGEEVWSVRESTGELFKNRVIDAVNNGIRDTVKVTTDCNRFLISTPDHRYFSSKHCYVDASDLTFRNGLKILNKGATYRNLNVPVTVITDGDQIPLIIGFNDDMRDYVMQGELLSRTAKDTAISIPFYKFLSSFAVQSIRWVISGFSGNSFTSQKFKDAFWIDFNASIFKNSCNRMLSSSTTIINRENLIPNFGSYCVDFIPRISPFFKMSRERSFASFEWKLRKNVFTSMTRLMEFMYKSFMDVVGIISPITRNTHMRLCCPSGYFDSDFTLNAFSIFGVGRGSAFMTESSNSGIMGYEDFRTSSTENFKFHNDVINEWNVPVIYNQNVDSVIENGKEEVWDLTMEQDPNFIANGFVVHNSAGYGRITYVTAYLEAHHPLEYYASLLDSTSNPDKIATLIRNIMRKGVVIKPPHVNESGLGYGVGSDGFLYMGLNAIRSVGKSAELIVKERKNGKFSSFVEFCQRIPSCNKNAKVNLIKSGAFSWDKFICDRDKIDNVDVIAKLARKRTKKFDGSKALPIQIILECHINGYEFTELERQKNEREVLNSFITGHPAAVYQRLAPYLERGDTQVICPSEVNDCEIDTTVLLIGMIDSITKRFINKPGNRNHGRPYLSVVISDSKSHFNTNVWYPLCEELEKRLFTGQVAIFECSVKSDRFDPERRQLYIKTGAMLSSGVPIQGMFTTSANGDIDKIASSVGAIKNSCSHIGNNKIYTSFRGLTAVKPDILENCICEFGGNIKFLVDLGVSDAQ